MRILRESIEKLGILVPLDVYPSDPDRSDPKELRSNNLNDYRCGAIV